MPWPEFSAAASSASARLLIRERAESFLSRVTLSADDSAWLVGVSGFLTLADSLAELRLLLELSDEESGEIPRFFSSYISFLRTGLTHPKKTLFRSS